MQFLTSSAVVVHSNSGRNDVPYQVPEPRAAFRRRLSLEFQCMALGLEHRKRTRMVPVVLASHLQQTGVEGQQGQQEVRAVVEEHQ